ncbi:hypothetical protein MRB53_007306 [Persea americana]|uniref:Uncharacterized protein n=1 Tax=Persea americana TaxID=3435 RepID=A0ACC2MJ64_PERAE|nr:hypothetical protein MRB53_007306 [Persea americana]
MPRRNSYRCSSLCRRSSGRTAPRALACVWVLCYALLRTSHAPPPEPAASHAPPPAPVQSGGFAKGMEQMHATVTPKPSRIA